MRTLGKKWIGGAVAIGLTVGVSGCGAGAGTGTKAAIEGEVAKAPDKRQAEVDPVLEKWQRDQAKWREETKKAEIEALAVEVAKDELEIAKAKVLTPGLLLDRIEKGRQVFDRAGNLTELDLSGMQLGADDFDIVGSLEWLTRLNLYDTNVGDEHLVKLYGLKRLRLIDLYETNVTALGLRKLTGALGSVSVDRFGPRSLDEFLERIPSDRVTVTGGQWVGLDLSGLAISQGDLNHVVKLPTLQTLDLSRLKATDGWLEKLEGLRQLKRLTLGANAEVTLEGLLKLHEAAPSLEAGEIVKSHREFITRIEAENDEAVTRDGEESGGRIIGIDLTDASLTRADYVALGRISSLRSLRLGFTSTDDAALGALSNLTQLERLTLSHTRITDEGLRHLSKMQKLAILYLASTKITDAGMERLIRMEGLESVYLEGTAVTAVGLFQLREGKKGIVLDR